jgi:regulator of ribonuclease activity A
MKPTCDFFDEHGVAETVKTFEVNSRVKERAKTSGEGRVIVVDGSGSLCRALCGDIIAAEAMANGWAGLVIWGAVRDVEQLGATNIGTMALGQTPARCVRKGEDEVEADLRLDGVAVSYGDYFVADADRALVFPQNGPHLDAKTTHPDA